MKSLENNYIPRRAISRRIPVAPDTPPTPPARSPPPRGRAEARRRSERGGVRAPGPRRARGSRVKVRRRPKKQRGERRGADRPSPNGNDGRSRSTGGFVSAGRPGEVHAPPGGTEIQPDGARGERLAALAAAHSARAAGDLPRAFRRVIACPRGRAARRPPHRKPRRSGPRRPARAAKPGVPAESRRPPRRRGIERRIFRFPRSSRPAAGPRPAFAKKSASRPRRAESVKRKNGPAARKFSA